MRRDEVSEVAEPGEDVLLQCGEVLVELTFDLRDGLVDPIAVGVVAHPTQEEVEGLAADAAEDA